MSKTVTPLLLLIAPALLAGACAGPAQRPASRCDSASPATSRPEVALRPAMRGATTLGLATQDLTDRTGENPTTATWDGKVVVRRCPDPASNEDAEPGVVRGQYWCFHAFRPALVTVDDGGVPDFSHAFDGGFTSTTRHVSHSGGFPVVENQAPAARHNPYRSTIDGEACGVASLEALPPPCPTERYSTYDVHIIHSAGHTNPTLFADYPDYPLGEGTAMYIEQMLIVVQDAQNESATVVDVIRNSIPYPMVADPGGFAFVYDAADDTVRNPYLFRGESDTTTYIGGVSSLEPGATNDGRLVVFNGGSENRYGPNLVYTWNPDPAAQTGWSPPKNIAYMYYVEGPGSPTGETLIAIDGVDYPFSDIFPIAKQPLLDQDGRPYDIGATYTPATRDPMATESLYTFAESVVNEMYIGSYPWVSWDGRNIMSMAIGRFNVAVIGDLTGYGSVWIDGAIDRTDFVGADAHQIIALWTLGQWPGRWAQYGIELEGKARTVPTRLSDAVTWALFEQDHYSEISFHKTDGSYALYLPMSRMRDRTAHYREGATPDVSGRFNNGELVQGGGRVAFSQKLSSAGFHEEPQTRVFGFSGNSLGFLSDASDAHVEPHVRAAPPTGVDAAITVEAAIYLETGPSLPLQPWATVVRQPGSYALGVNEQQRPWFEVIDDDGTATTIVADAKLDAGRWIHLTGVSDGSEIRLYVDAKLSTVVPATGRPIAAAGDDIYIGPKNHDGDAAGDGLVFIDEVGVSPSARTFEEIAHRAFQRPQWPTASLAEWESMWGVSNMPLGLVDGDGTLLAPIHLGFELGNRTGDRIALGERLFHDDALSTTTPPISCESCHTLTAEHGGARTGEIVSTQGAAAITRHTPTVYNRVFGRRQFWDGRAHGLAAQSLFPIASPVEMNLPLADLVDKVLPDNGYETDLCAAFGRRKASLPQLEEAFALYESGFVSGNSAVDRHRFLGESLSESEQRGMALFATKARCIGCHAPPLYTDERFHDNAQGNDGDLGRASFTAQPGDAGKFRTMSLRDVDRTPPYMHDGSVPTLREVVERYNLGGDDRGEVAMRPLHLTPEEVTDLVAFLTALRSEQHVIGLR